MNNHPLLSAMKALVEKENPEANEIKGHILDDMGTLEIYAVYDHETREYRFDSDECFMEIQPKRGMECFMPVPTPLVRLYIQYLNEVEKEEK